jgi:hypothetical protein
LDGDVVEQRVPLRRVAAVEEIDVVVVDLEGPAPITAACSGEGSISVEDAL